MIRPIIFALGLIALIGVTSGLESNPIAKIDKYLSNQANSFDPSTNFKLAEEYYESEKQVGHKFKSNKKLLEALEDFLGLKHLIDGDKQKNCNLQAIDKLKRIRDIYANDCRQEFYATLEKKLDTMFVLDMAIGGRLYDFMEAIMFPRGRQDGGREYSVNVMYGMIINKQESEILEPQYIRDAYGSCYRDFNITGSFKDSVQKCWLDPCQQYVNKLSDVYNTAALVGLKPDVRVLENASPETQKYFEHWAQFRLCQALLSKGASQLKKDYLQGGARYSGSGLGGSGSGTIMAAMVGR